MITIPFYLHSFNLPQDNEDCEDILRAIGDYHPGLDVGLSVRPCLCESQFVTPNSPAVLFQGNRGRRTECYEKSRQVMLSHPGTIFFDLGLNLTPCDTGSGYLLMPEFKPLNFTRATRPGLRNAIENILKLYKN